MATVFLNNFPLEEVPFSWPIYLGAQPRAVSIGQGDRALATDGNLLRQGRPPLPSVIRPVGNQLTFRAEQGGADASATFREIVCEWIAPGNGRSAEVVLYDVRWFLRRARMRADINRRMRDGRYVDRFQRFEEVVEYMIDIVREDTGRAIVTRYAPDGVRSEDLPDDIYTAGMTIADALDAAMGAVVATCFVDTEGRLTFQRLAAGGQVEDVVIRADKWVSEPAFEKEAVAPTAPSRVTVLYQRELEKFVELAPRTVAPDDTQPYLSQVYQIDGDWLSVAEFEQWYLRNTNFAVDFSDDNVRKYWNKGNLAGLFPNLEDSAADVAAIVAQWTGVAVKALEQWFRRAFQVQNADGGSFDAAVQIAQYRRDDQNNITGVTGAGVYANWIGFYQNPQAVGRTLEGAITAINHPFGPAPYGVAYDPEARVVVLTPDTGAAQFAVTVLGELEEGGGSIKLLDVPDAPEGFADTVAVRNLRSLTIARDYELNIYYLVQPLAADERWYEVTPGGQSGEQTITIISDSFLARETDGGFVWTAERIERDAKRWADLIRLAETARSGDAEAHGVQLLKRFNYFRNGLTELAVNAHTLGTGSLTTTVRYGPSRQVQAAQEALKRAARTEAIDTGDLRP